MGPIRQAPASAYLPITAVKIQLTGAIRSPLQEDENSKLKAELNVIVQAKAETQPPSIDSGKIVALESQITSLEAKLAKANVDLNAAIFYTSSKLPNMFVVNLKNDELESYCNLPPDLPNWTSLPIPFRP